MVRAPTVRHGVTHSQLEDLTIAPSADFPFKARHTDVLGSSMHYIEEGDGDPILFVHGNPTSSYLWRNILPTAAQHGRAIAVDLIGMGKSDKPDLAYRFEDHLRYLTGFIDALDLQNVTVVLHDWGGGLGLAWARLHGDRVKAVAFMECVLMPTESSGMPPQFRALFGAFRTPVLGAVINQRLGFFHKVLVPQMVMRSLSKVETAMYAAPYPDARSRRPVAQWPKEIPIDGSPADVHAHIAANWEWLKTAEVPKLFLHVTPGAIINPKVAVQVQREVVGVEAVHVGKALHYIQEDVPEAISAALDDWLPRALAS